MSSDLTIAIVAAMLNILLSLIIPPLLKTAEFPFSEEVKRNYKTNSDIIMISSIITVILVYISLKISPWIDSNIFVNIAKLSKK